ncbi:WD40 repeat-like protein [Flagelloscypha sp. PMI_526]|nr:WD40 repeat-like protein [Flagelloscypha sp. PMI_526]
MSSLRNSAFGKRVRAQQQDGQHPEDEPNKRQRINPIFDTTTSPTPTTSTTPIALQAPASIVPSAIQPTHLDRFVPHRESSEMTVGYNLRKDREQSPASGSRIIQPESDALREQANALYQNVLHGEIDPTDRPGSPVRPGPAPQNPRDATAPSTPTRVDRGRRLFAYASPSTPPRNNSVDRSPSRKPGLNSPNHPQFNLSPIRSSSQTTLNSPRRKLRSVCKTPYRVLDAPELAEDFYLNLVDWSSTNILGVGLGSCVYLWSAQDANVNKLCDVSGGPGHSTDVVSSVAWVQRGGALAVATLGGHLSIYDGPTLQLIRTYENAHSMRIGALAWNGAVLSSGSRDRAIHHRDVREQTTSPWKQSIGHRQEVCGLKWSSAASSPSEGGSSAISTAYLASGGNDNKVCVWDLRGTARTNPTGRAPVSSVATHCSMARGPAQPHTTVPLNNHTAQYGTASRPSGSGSSPGSSSSSVSDSDPLSANDAPLWKFHEHTAAVKALAWDPHLPGILATGGGTADKHIRFWNTSSGSLLSQLDTGSQVCNLTWSLTSHELVSTHGYSSTTAQNQICIWRYPSLECVASLSGHSNRVLYLAMSPDGETIVTGAGDETLRFWNAFPKREMESRDREEEAETDGGGVAKGGKLDWGTMLR